jgi:hypothetical protein
MNSLTEQVAAERLRRDGVAVIWQAHDTAARAYRNGNPRAAEILLRIADAAEEAVRRDIPGTVVGIRPDLATYQSGGRRRIKGRLPIVITDPGLTYTS